MTLQAITASDIKGWESLDDIASSLEKRGLKRRPNLSDENELALQLADTEFIVLVEAGANESASDFKPDNRNRRTNLVATNDYEEFTFLTSVRNWEGQQHGRIEHREVSFTKEQVTNGSDEENAILQMLNAIEYGSTEAIDEILYDTKQVVKKFYRQFEELHTDLVEEVAGIPDDQRDAKHQYVQTVLNRLIFLYFIQEKRLLDRNPNYLHEMHEVQVRKGTDAHVEFYEPLFFDLLAEGKQDPEFGHLPYLNVDLFTKTSVEEEFENVRLGETGERTNDLFGDIHELLSDWNWNVDERLDITDLKTLTPAVFGHIFEQTVDRKEGATLHTTEEVTGEISRQTIHSHILNRLNETVNADYEAIDEVFGFSAPNTGADTSKSLRETKENIQTSHVEVLYHDILTEMCVFDPEVGSGASLLTAQDVLLDIYLRCIDFFQHLESEGEGWVLDTRTREELERIEDCQGNASLQAKRQTIQNNLYGVDGDDRAVEICKLRLWLSMVAEIEENPHAVKPLPESEFNIDRGISLLDSR